MQFNQAQHSSHAHSWETQHELLVRKYKVAGLKACGEPWKPPHIIFWNLRGNTTGFPATADTEGVTMLSGFSPSLLKLLLSGEDLEQGEEIIEEVINADGEVVLTKTKVSRRPIDVVRSALDDSQYDKVRAILGRSKEGLLAGYEFEPPSSDEAEGDWVM
jgi:NACalpha-BTF3-like transcription factor